jgi:hypothetical protein
MLLPAPQLWPTNFWGVLQLALMIGFFVIAIISQALVTIVVYTLASWAKSRAEYFYDTLRTDGVVALTAPVTIKQAFAEMNTALRDSIMETDVNSIKKYRDIYYKNQLILNETQNSLEIISDRYRYGRESVKELSNVTIKFIKTTDTIIELAELNKNKEALLLLRNTTINNASSDFYALVLKIENDMRESVIRDDSEVEIISEILIGILIITGFAILCFIFFTTVVAVILGNALNKATAENKL